MRMDELELGKAYLEFAIEVNPSIPRGYANLVRPPGPSPPGLSNKS